MRSSSWRRLSPRLVIAFLTLGAVWACSDLVRPEPDLTSGAASGPARAVIDASGCGVSFIAVTENEDGVLAQYGIPSAQDTLHICQTWTGNDYILRATVLGAVASAFELPDIGRTTVYEGGMISAYDAGGSVVYAPVAVGSSAFDFMMVDAPTIAASYDAPYYAVYAGGCDDPRQLSCGTMLQQSRAASQSVAASPDAATADTGKKSADAKFTKHGLTRRGVRALVDDAEEIAKSPEGDRRFRKVRGDTEMILTVDKASALLIGEEFRAPGRESKTKHQWKKGKEGYIRERTETELTEVVGRKTIVSHRSIELLNFTLGEAVAP